MTGIARRVRAGLAVATLAALLAGCAGGTNATNDTVDQGYQSGDGSTKTWAADDRGDPVALDGTDFEGEVVDIASSRGDVVVLNTWYAACPPCRKEAPDLVALATDYEAKGVRFVGINGTDAAGAAQAFERTFKVPYPSIADSDGRAIAALQGAVPVQAVPTTVVLDRGGRVAARILGLADRSTLRALIDDVLAEPTPTSPGS